MQQSIVLFGDYTYYRKHTAHYKSVRQTTFLRELQSTKARLSIMEQMAAWCSRQGIDASQWLYSLFVNRQWLFAPPLVIGQLTSKKSLEKYKKFNDYKFYNDYQREKILAARCRNNTQFDPNRDVNPSIEKYKLYYKSQNRFDACMDDMTVHTFGYHPKSLVCLDCPIRLECKTKLEAIVNFDIMALRLGFLSSETAQIQARTRAQGYVRR